MEMQEKILMTERNIRQAVKDYGAHTYSNGVLSDVSDEFISRLAEDSVEAKQGLREVFRKSPAWNEELDALVINGTRTHDPDCARVEKLGRDILRPVYGEGRDAWLNDALSFFTHYGGDHTAAIEAINYLAPKAYAPGKKKSRVFKALCKALGIADETAGSRFQALYAQFADELSAKKINYKLFVSLNPAHFVTMSNPKNDRRGDMLTSCHSFNSTQYDYNNGCSGYARDAVTMIAFTVADPNNPETLNNRKTTRQLFMYRPGSGVLLQSRMYNTSGGTCGAQAESKIYRDLIQREISECEGVPNLWKTRKYCGNDFGVTIDIGYGFGGYADWTYEEFAAMVSLRNEHSDDWQRGFEVGTWGLCIVCGEAISDGLRCNACKSGSHDDDCYCEDCDEYVDETYTVYQNGEERQVCESCRDENYYRCADCGEWHDRDGVVELANGDYVCESCRDEYYRECEECGEWYHRDDMTTVYNERGHEVGVCDYCHDRYYERCEDCDEWYRSDSMSTVHDADGDEIRVCDSCLDNYCKCGECGEWYHTDSMTDGRCSDRYEEQEAEAV